MDSLNIGHIHMGTRRSSFGSLPVVGRRPPLSSAVPEKGLTARFCCSFPAVCPDREPPPSSRGPMAGRKRSAQSLRSLVHGCVEFLHGHLAIGERALAWIANYRDNARPGFVVGKNEGTLFLNIIGEPLDLQYLTQLIAEYVDRADIGKQGLLPHVPPHDGHTDAGERRGHPRHPGHPRPLEPRNHADLYPCEHSAPEGRAHGHASRKARQGQAACPGGRKGARGAQGAEDVLSRLDLEAEEEV